MDLQHNEMSDSEALEAVQQGDMDTFELFYDRYGRSLYSRAYFMLRNSEDAEDAVQETFVRMYENLAKLDGERLSAFLHAVLRNLVVDWIRRGLKEWSEALVGDELDKAVARDLSPEEGLVRRGMLVQLRKCLAALPENYRAVIVLVEIDELTYCSAAADLDITEDNCRQRVHRGREKLRECMERADFA